MNANSKMSMDICSECRDTNVVSASGDDNSMIADSTVASEKISVVSACDMVIETVSESDFSNIDHDESYSDDCFDEEDKWEWPIDRVVDCSRKDMLFDGIITETMAGNNNARQNVSSHGGNRITSGGRRTNQTTRASETIRARITQSSTRNRSPRRTHTPYNAITTVFVRQDGCCDNCRRQCTLQREELYRIALQSSTVSRTSFGRKFSTYKWRDVKDILTVRNQTVRMKLCEACHMYLTSNDYKHDRWLWPAMVWSWLSDSATIERHGNLLWTAIPKEWRSWWLHSVRLTNTVFASVTHDFPKSVFADVTLQQRDLEEAIDNNEGGQLIRACNEHLHATVWCPWGESEFLHKCGKLPLDLIVGRFFGDTIRMKDGNARTVFEKVTGVLDDFLEGNYVSILRNPKWQVRPSISFVDGVPVVLTCRKHKRGCHDKFFHLPRNPRGPLPSWQSDQLTPAVVRPRTLKQFKTHKYSDSYQMHEMQGQFNGVDTVRVCEHHNFLTDSKILRDKAEVSLLGRKDLRALVADWAQDNTLPPDVAQQRILDAERYGPTEDEMKLSCRGATFMTLQDSLKVQQMNKSKQGRVVSIEEKGFAKERHFVPPWPACLINVHPYDDFGATFPVLPKMYDKDREVRLAFYLVAMHATIPYLWENTNQYMETDKSWEGWLLAYVSKKCYASCTTTAKKNPFNFINWTGKDCLNELLIRIGMSEGPVPDNKKAAQRSSMGNSSLTGTNSPSTATAIATSVTQSLLSTAVASARSNLSAATNENTSGNEGSEESSVCTIGWNVNADDDSSIGWNEDDDSSTVSQYSMGWVSDESESPLFTDGRFHPSDLEPLFARHSEITVGPCGTLPTIINSLTPASKCIIVYRFADSEDVNGVSLQHKIIDRENEEWKLRFMGGCNPHNRGDRFIVARHGSIFSRWWRHTYKNKPSQDFVREKLPDLHDFAVYSCMWEVGIYVRVKCMPVEECRDIMLRTMGSEPFMICNEHNIPLITAPYKTDLPCMLKDSDTNKCSKSISWRCPVRDCASAVCKKHGEVVIDNKEIVRIGLQIPLSQPTLQNLDEQESSKCIDDNGIINDDESVDLDDGTNLLFSAIIDEMENVYNNSAVCVEELQGDGKDEYSEKNSEENEPSADFRDDLVTDAILDDNVPFVQSRDDEEDYDETNFPIACSDEEPLTIRGDPSAISGCCILNNVGSLLARKGSKLRGSMNEKFFLQRIASTTPGRVVPLVYPEAMLFPSLFWKDAKDDGAMLGAIPCGLMGHDATLRRFGIAGLHSHMYSRLTNPTFGTGADPRYICYAFDAMVNLSCRHEDVRVILHRGVTGTSTGVRVMDSGPGNVTDKSFFDTDSVDSRPVVNKLAAAVSEKQATYFYTHTCNATEHFGVAPIRNWIESDEALEAWCDGTESFEEKEEIRKSLRQTASVVLLRNWIEVSLLYMHYIEHSDDKPLGDVDYMWWRFEFQESVGNLPHIHALLWLKEGESVRVSQERICGSIMELIQPEEIDTLVAKGLLSCAEEAMTVQEMGQRVLAHICNSRCMRRTGTKDGELVCRVTNNALESPDSSKHCMGEIEVNHSDAAMKVFVDIGLFVEDEHGNFVPIVDKLKATKHYPPSYSHEGIISACSGFLFTMSKSNDNVKWVTGYLSSRYLAKYLSLVDENNRVYIGSASQERNTLTMEQVTLHNTKVTSSAIQEAKKDLARQGKKNPKPTGRAISHMEMLCVLLGYEQVYTTIKFVHIPTVPLEERPAFDRRLPFARLKEEKIVSQHSPVRRPQDLDAGNVIASFKVRNVERKVKLPLWRLLGDVESLILRDQCLAVHTVDAITLFGIRPPELRFIREPGKYFKWFYREDGLKKRTFDNALLLQREASRPKLADSAWVDGAEFRVFVRPSALRQIVQYLEGRSHESFYPWDKERDGLIPARGHRRPPLENGQIFPKEEPQNEIKDLFGKMCAYNDNPPRNTTNQYNNRYDEWQYLHRKFIGPAAKGGNSIIPVIWYNSVKPIQGERFLLHVLLSMGEFDCETNLLGYGNMVDNFERARLIRENATDQQRLDDIKILARRYIVDQLIGLPGGHEQFDRLSIAAEQVLRYTLTGKGIPSAEMPATLFTHIVQQTEAKVQKHASSLRHTLACTTMKDLEKAQMMKLPHSVKDVTEATPATPCKWTIDLVKTEGQSDESYEEQLEVVRIMKEQLDKYQFDISAQTKALAITGGPGTGKTTCLQAGGLESMCRGLNTNLGSLMSERSRQLGGIHISNFFMIPVNEKASPGRLAELSIAKLLRNPKQLAVIQALDVFILDELGQISAELLATMDIILRRIRNSTEFMGGVLILATLDSCQLQPIRGRPPLMSPHMLTSFEFVELIHSVRAYYDGNLCRIIDISRMRSRERTPEIRNVFKRLIINYCQFANSWDDPKLPTDILRIFATNKARAHAEQEMIAKMKQKFHNCILCHKAQDFESSTESNWIPASHPTIKLLSEHSGVKEPRKLYFYPGAIYEITYNRDGQFSQSQLAVLCSMPTKADVQDLQPVSILVAPEGMKAIPSQLTTKEHFIQEGFQERRIGLAPEHTKDLGLGILGKRRQYGLRHRFAATIHAAMGQDLPGVATQVIGAKMYHLFLKEQVVVILSRTHYAKDLWFVGDPEETAEALASMLDNDGPYTEYMNYLIDKLVHHSAVRGPSVDLTAKHPFFPCNVKLPNDNAGYCYLLVSMAKGASNSVHYIGECVNLIRRLDVHKRRAGPSATADPDLQPWALLAFVSGFGENSKSERMCFERLWQAYRKRDKLYRREHNMAPLTANAVGDLGERLVKEGLYRSCPTLRHLKLVYTRCGYFRPPTST